MSTTGPKGPADTTAIGRVLQFRRPETSPLTETAPVKQPSVKQTEPAPAAPVDGPPAAVFESTPGQTSQSQVLAPVEGAALSQLIARLKPRSEGHGLTSVNGPTFIQTNEGKVLSGSLEIEGKAGMQKLEGVVRAGGDVAVSGILKNADLLAMRDLRVVEGRLTFESLRSKVAVD